MGRYRERSRSYSPKRTHRDHDDRSHRDYDDRSHRDRRPVRDRRSPGPSGLLVRNISLTARPEDLRIPFERFGPVKDVYLPKNYYTGEARGFGFVKFRNSEDAAEAKHHLNDTVIGGRQIAIVFAAENRKTPQDMRRSGGGSGRHGGSSRRWSPPRSPRRRYRSYSRSRSPSPARNGSRDKRARDHYPPSHSRSISRSVSPRDDKEYRSSRKSISPNRNGKSPNDKEHHGSDQRSARLRDKDVSPHGDDYSPGQKKEPELVRKEIDARDDVRSLPRSMSKSRNRSQTRSPSYSR
ncbi:serine/arginine-rich SC35-like splicing factor SCL30A isoform X2 [Apium graveolens]|uniref:serine/arginine-rich SC35-like splicing factor SCL30A isoform X2 n=1 Tax=Apium graveolens TaxID=4045 RepID=UPI003D7B4A0A